MSPDLGLVLWTLFVFVVAALLLYVLVRSAIHLRRQAKKR